MATKKKRSGGDVITLTGEDFKSKSFKTAPGGTYVAKVVKGKDTKITPGKNGKNMAKVKMIITKGEHKGVTFFENFFTHVAWKIGQALAAVGQTKKLKLTLKELIDILIAAGEFRVILREKKFEGKKRNEVVQFLPLKKTVEEDDDEDDEDEDESDDDDDTEDSDDEDSDDDDSDDDDSDDDDDDEDEDEEDDDSDSDDDDDEDEEDEDDDDDEEDDSSDEDDDDDDDDDDEEEEEPVVKKKAAPVVKKKAKK